MAQQITKTILDTTKPLINPMVTPVLPPPVCPGCFLKVYLYRRGVCRTCFHAKKWQGGKSGRKPKVVEPEELENYTLQEKLKDAKLRKRFKITLHDYRELEKEQEGSCAICTRPPKKRALAVDHHHKTGKVRGLLCYQCNYGIGWFQESPWWLRKAAQYLEDNK